MVDDEEEALQADDRFLLQRQLPSGRCLGVMPLLGDLVQLGIDELPPLEKTGSFADFWHYPDLISALRAYCSFDEGGEEPTGWYRHPSTNRYRIEADPKREYVRDYSGDIFLNFAAALKAVRGDYRTIQREDIREDKEALGSSFPHGTIHVVVTSFSNECDHDPACCWVDRVYHYLDRSVVVGIQELRSISVGQIIDRLTTPLFPGPLWGPEKKRREFGEDDVQEGKNTWGGRSGKKQH